MTTAHTNQMRIGDLSSQLATMLLATTACILFVVRVSAPHNFLDKDQERPAAYVLDVLNNGHWICQRDWMGDVTSKPPMLTWTIALIAKAFRRFEPWMLFVPSALAWGGLALVIFAWSKRFIPVWAACWAGLMLLASPLGARLFILVRTDALFAFTVAITAFAGWHAMQHGSGWTWFWLCAGIATLTKGPLGLVLGAMGMLYALWERPYRISIVSRKHWLGLALYIAMVGGWFLLAYWQWGSAVTDKLLRRELIAHAVNIGDTDPLWLRWPKPTLYLIHRMLPWSLLSLLGIARSIRARVRGAGLPCWEGFLLCWFLGGLAIFSVTQHQRGDLLAPILAPAMIIAARELHSWTEKASARARWIGTTFFLIIFLTLSTFYYHRVEGQSVTARATRCLQHFARTIQQTSCAQYLSFLDAPYTLQLYLGTMKLAITEEDILAQIVRSEPFAVAMSREAFARVASKLSETSLAPYIVAETDCPDLADIVVLANRLSP